MVFAAVSGAYESRLAEKLTISPVSHHLVRSTLQYCAGNIAGPQFIYKDEAPRYQSGAYAMCKPTSDLRPPPFLQLG